MADHTARAREEHRTPAEALAIGLNPRRYCVSGLRTFDHHHTHVALLYCRPCRHRFRARKVPAGWNMLWGAGYVGGIAHLVRSSRAGGGAACSPGVFQPAGSPQTYCVLSRAGRSACRAADPACAIDRWTRRRAGMEVRETRQPQPANDRTVEMMRPDFTQWIVLAFTHATSPFDFPSEGILRDAVVRHESLRSRSVGFRMSLD